MKLEGSCHCGAVTFSVNSRTPYPFNHCYCSKCRKTGGGGFAINIMGEHATLEVTGEENISVYRSKNNHRGRLRGRRAGLFAAPFLQDLRDAALDLQPELRRVRLPLRDGDRHPAAAPRRDDPPHAGLQAGLGAGARDGHAHTHHTYYPDGGIEQWHRDRGLYEED